MASHCASSCYPEVFDLLRGVEKQSVVMIVSPLLADEAHCIKIWLVAVETLIQILILLSTFT